MERELRIKSITEAYSQQPETFRVCEKEMDYSHTGYVEDKPHIHKPGCIKRIELVGNAYYVTNFNDEVLRVRKALRECQSPVCILPNGHW